VFSGFIILKPLKTNTAALVAQALWEVFAIMGLPRIIQSDNGTEFVNKVISAIKVLCGLEYRFISPYNPRADGKVERSIRTVTSIIKKLLDGAAAHWPAYVPFAQLCFNRKISDLTGSSPFSLMFGRKPNPIADYTKYPPVVIDPTSIDEWRKFQDKIVSLIYPAVTDRIMVKKDEMLKRLNDTRRMLLKNDITPGTIVGLRDPVRSNKWEPPYLGPMTVVRRTRNGAYVLKAVDGRVLDRHVPADQLKIISKRPADRRKKVDDKSYEYEKILKRKGKFPNYFYFIKWKGFPSTENTWESGNNIHDKDALKRFNEVWDELHPEDKPTSSYPQVTDASGEVLHDGSERTNHDIISTDLPNDLLDTTLSPATTTIIDTPTPITLPDHAIDAMDTKVDVPVVPSNDKDVTTPPIVAGGTGDLSYLHESVSDDEHKDISDTGKKKKKPRLITKKNDRKKKEVKKKANDKKKKK
jgi:hypothetical protein